MAMLVLVASGEVGCLAPRGAMEQSITASAKADVAFIEQYLGPGVLGPAIPAPPITAPRDYLPSGAVRMTFRIFEGAAGTGQSSNEVEEFSLVSQPGTTERWVMRVGNRTAWYLEAAADGSIGRTSQLDTAQSLTSFFSPMELLLVPGMTPGQVVQRDVAVTVTDAARPDDVKYRGSLRQTLTYVGAYTVTVPAGTFEAILLDSTFYGTVGPATIKDHVCLLLAKGVGRVAAVEQKSVSAFLFYNRDQRHGRLLVSRESLP